MSDVGEPAHRIGVANLDAVEQTRTWLALGGPQATRTLVGALRTALLLADTVVLDRNQVFEGVFFIAMTPDRLAWELGLPPGAPLPLSVGLLNNAEASLWPRQQPPWLTDHGGAWALDEAAVRDLDRNYLAVPGDRQRVSSPMIALTGRYDGQVADGGLSVNAPAPSPAWQEETDPAFLPPHLWSREPRDDVLAAETIRRGRLAWLEAMKTGRVAVEPWARAALQMGPALERALPSDPDARRLAVELLALEEVVGHTEECGCVHADLSPGTDASGTGAAGADAASTDVPRDVTASSGVCGRRHVGRRSLLVRWLDGLEVPELSPPRMGSAWEGATYETREAAFRWWSTAYYDAICERDGLRMLNLHGVGAATGAEAALEVAWGLRRPDPSRWERARSRLSRRSGGEQGDLVVEGEMVRHLRDLGPWKFASLREQDIVDRTELWKRPRNRDMFELALAVREAADQHEKRLRRIVVDLRRLLVVAVIAAAFAFKDAGFLPDRGGPVVAFWLVLGILAGFPWDAARSLLTMSPGDLESTLRIRE